MKPFNRGGLCLVVEAGIERQDLPACCLSVMLATAAAAAASVALLRSQPSGAVPCRAPSAGLPRAAVPPSSAVVLNRTMRANRNRVGLAPEPRRTTTAASAAACRPPPPSSNARAAAVRTGLFLAGLAEQSCEDCHALSVAKPSSMLPLH